MHCTLDLELKLHTLLDFFVFVFLFFVLLERFSYIYIERERGGGEERTSGSAGLLTSVSALAVPYSRESEERI